VLQSLPEPMRERLQKALAERQRQEAEDKAKREATQATQLATIEDNARNACVERFGMLPDEIIPHPRQDFHGNDYADVTFGATSLRIIVPLFHSSPMQVLLYCPVCHRPVYHNDWCYDLAELARQIINPPTVPPCPECAADLLADVEDATEREPEAAVNDDWPERLTAGLIELIDERIAAYHNQEE
jgi:hypothetical protein